MNNKFVFKLTCAFSLFAILYCFMGQTHSVVTKVSPQDEVKTQASADDIIREATQIPNTIPILRRDEKDRYLVIDVVKNELQRLRNINPKLTDDEVANRIKIYTEGVWAVFGVLTDLLIEEYVAVNNKLITDPDHWYEVNIANAVLFDNLTLKGHLEVLPGRLFTTRMPRDLPTNPESVEKFKEKVRLNNLKTVLILTETEEYEKYAHADLEAFYTSIGLEIIHRPIPDFSVPDQSDMIENIRDITYCLSEGKACLVHCAGGNGRTGMVIAGIIKNVGIKDPVAWIRRFKTIYVETVAQENFVKSLPMVLDERIARRHPVLAKAIAAERIIDIALSGKYKSNSEKFTCTRKQSTDYGATFDLIDTDRSGFITVEELKELFKYVGADILEETIQKFYNADANQRISKQQFLEMMLSNESQQPHHP